MFRKSLRQFLVLSIAIFVTIAFTNIAVSQNLLTDIEISEVETSEFPQVSVVLQARDESGKPVLGLGSSDFEISEDGQPVSVSSVSIREAGVYIHFVIDAGAGLVNPASDPRWDNARNSIVNFVQTTPWAKEGLDTIAVSAVTAAGTQQVVAPTSENMSSIAQTLQNFTPPGGTELSGAVSASQELIDVINADPLADGKSKFIVLLSPNFEKGSDAQINSLVEKSVGSNIPVYTILLRRTPDQYSAKVRDLAERTNGVYTEFTGNTSLISAYEEITSYRNQYQLDYNSSSSISGLRNVVVKSNIGNGSIQAQESYNIELSPPRVVIVAPEDGKFVSRTATEFTEQIDSIEPTNQTVSAEVIFPDGFPRRLASAKLLVDGEVVGTATGTRELEFDWDLRTNQILGTTPYKLAVEVEDVLGLSALSSEIKIDVKLEIPPDVAQAIDIEALTEGLEEDIREDIIKEFEAVLIPCSTEQWLDGSLCSTERFIRGNLISLAAILVSIGAIVYVSQSNSRVAVNVRQTAKDVYARVTSRYQRAEARAYLEVMEGDPNLIGQSIEIYGDTPVGRSREVSEVIFQQNDPNSPISRLHCTIIDQEDHFKIQDEDSANGTFLNGARMRPLVEEELRDGDYIELGQIARGGVKILFKVAEDEFDSEDDLRETQSTLNPSSSNSFSDDGDDF